MTPLKRRASVSVLTSVAAIVVAYLLFIGLKKSGLPVGLDATMLKSSVVSHAAKPLSAPLRLTSLYTPVNPDADRVPMASTGPRWAQKTITLPPQRRGCHLITPKILKEIGPDLSDFRCGLAHLFLHHTSASLTINENYDSDVRDDTETFLNKIVPEGRSAPWKHTLEGTSYEYSYPSGEISDITISCSSPEMEKFAKGSSQHVDVDEENCPDDMPAHIKSSMFGCQLTIPITDGKLNLGTWQGIWLCEHRDAPTARRLVVTLNGV